MTPDIQELKRLAEAATAGNLDTVPNPPTEYGGKEEEGCVVCPQCEGEGAVDAVTYTNFDGVAMGVQFFGIGDEFKRYEAYFRGASPSTILALIEENERMKQGLTDFHKKLSDRADWLRSEYLKGGDFVRLKEREDECRYILRTALEGAKK